MRTILERSESGDAPDYLEGYNLTQLIEYYNYVNEYFNGSLTEVRIDGFVLETAFSCACNEICGRCKFTSQLLVSFIEEKAWRGRFAPLEQRCTIVQRAFSNAIYTEFIGQVC